ncbi:hypothetical protein DTO217A2_451 [Paecilomyces variotii]|nr:hypothetical protein DTO217A2_451 [Paecilomyces variotii]KAJ9347819.1 hypothetical protein DTO027B9_8826 [Paecilomyces variotii]KAJ9372192.1 hypothetical protein DTO282E5_3034 [Paecilomyces variotii]
MAMATKLQKLSIFPSIPVHASSVFLPFFSSFLSISFERHSRKDARRTVNLDFDARVPIPFSVFPSSYRSDAVSEATHTRVEGEVNLDRTSRVGREDTRIAAPLPDPNVYGKEEVDVDVRYTSDDRRRPARRYEESDLVYEERERYPEVELSRERYRAPIGHHRPGPDRAEVESQLDITEREYRRRVHPPTYEVDAAYSSSAYEPVESYRSNNSRSSTREVDVDAYRTSSRYSAPTEVNVSKTTVYEKDPKTKMGYYDDEGHYHSFRRGVERAADRFLHPFHSEAKEDVVVQERAPARRRENVRVVRPRSGHPPDTVPIPCHFIRIGDLLVLQGRPCQVIRISVSSQTGQHRYLGVDLFTRQLHEESSFVSNPSDSVVVQTMLGPVYKTYRVLDIEDGHVVAMTETGDVKQGVPVLNQGGLFERLSDAFADGRGSVRALVINDGGRELGRSVTGKGCCFFCIYATYDFFSEDR